MPGVVEHDVDAAELATPRWRSWLRRRPPRPRPSRTKRRLFACSVRRADSRNSLPTASFRSATTTRAPSARKRSAVARPMPLAPPVMTATLSSRRPGMSRPPALVAGASLPQRPRALSANGNARSRLSSSFSRFRPSAARAANIRRVGTNTSPTSSVANSGLQPQPQRSLPAHAAQQNHASFFRIDGVAQAHSRSGGSFR